MNCAQIQGSFKRKQMKLGGKRKLSCDSGAGGPLTKKQSTGSGSNGSTNDSKLWVERHKPKSLAEVVGNSANVQKLVKFLSHDPKETKAGAKRAILIGGPPGTGKTTAAHLAAVQCGFRVVELNASDDRSRSKIEKIISPLTSLGQTRIKFPSKTNVETNVAANIAIIADEVDGLDGTCDKGGLGYLVGLISKPSSSSSARVVPPMIFICNDMGDKKMRTLKTHCQVLYWQKPSNAQVLTRISAIARQEGLSGLPFDNIVNVCDGDIRHAINMLQMWQTDLARATPQRQQQQSKSIFDAAEDVFSPSVPFNCRLGRHMDEKFMMPLLVHENYPMCRRVATSVAHQEEDLGALVEASDYLSCGDLLESHSERNARFDDDDGIEMRGILSSVAPASTMLSTISTGEPSRKLCSKITFPKWLGNHSTASKNNRINKEVSWTVASAMGYSTSPKDLACGYMEALQRHLLTPMVKLGAKGVDETKRLLSSYKLTGEDYKLLLDKNPDAAKQIPAAAKSSLTRKMKGKKRMFVASVDGSDSEVDDDGSCD